MILEAALVAVGGFAGFVVLSFCVLRTLKAIAPAVVVIFSSFAAYFALMVIVATVRPPFLFWPSSGLYWFLALCFLMVFGAAYKSISLRILSDLLAEPDRCAAYEAVLQRYVERESFQDRLDIIIRERFATLTDQGYELTDKGRRLAASVYLLHRLFKIEKSG